MKAILISIQPEWVAKILNGEKTLEIRKSYPKCELPIDVYIYCTKELPLLLKNKDSNKIFINKLKAVEKDDLDRFPHIQKFNGKVVAKFTLNKVEPIAQYDGYEERYFTKSLWETELFEKSCLGLEEMRNYIHNHYGYAWHINDLVIFNEPKELSEFRYAVCPQTNCEYCKYNKTVDGDLYCTRKSLTRAPQSWCYVEV